MSKRKKVQVKYHKIYLDWIHYTVHVYFTNDPYYIRNVYLYKKFRLAPYHTDWYACHTDDRQKQAWIIYPTKAPKSVIVHELSHAVDTIMEIHGFEGQEFRAYMLGFLIEKVM